MRTVFMVLLSPLLAQSHLWHTGLEPAWGRHPELPLISGIVVGPLPSVPLRPTGHLGVAHSPPIAHFS
ncbi:hypothetical protein J6590_042506 [Homalodisca vitripennis]|nr:hypothetical protein J6590_042506 [Homalodisca vitripennis]